jgi:hypothetical protein
VDSVQNYLNPEDFQVAKDNGISYEMVYNRFYILGWQKERAITTPIKRRTWKWKDYEVACAEVGITRNAFNKRIKDGWDLKRASTTPFVPYSERRKNVKVTEEVKAIAAQNGIPEGTLKTRVYQYKWTVERAMTEPIHTQFRRNL